MAAAISAWMQAGPLGNDNSRRRAARPLPCSKHYLSGRYLLRQRTSSENEPASPVACGFIYEAHSNRGSPTGEYSVVYFASENVSLCAEQRHWTIWLYHSMRYSCTPSYKHTHTHTSSIQINTPALYQLLVRSYTSADNGQNWVSEAEVSHGKSHYLADPWLRQ